MTDVSEKSQDPAALLNWYLAAGVDEAILESPQDRFALSSTAKETSGIKQNTTAPETETKQPKSALKPVSAQSTAPIGKVEDAVKAAKAANTLAELKTAIEQFDGCALKQTATNAVFADGIEDADLMVIGDAPAAEEDKTGKPFQAEQGALLDKMLAAINYSRDENAYLACLIPWRPLGARKPDPAIAALYTPFLLRHIELAAPKAILILGGTVANCLFDTDASNISRLRGKWHDIDINGQKIAAIATYQPAYLLMQPRFKADAWSDLLSLKAKLHDLA